MGKFKISKKAYLDKVARNKDWENQEEDKVRPADNKTMRCRKYKGMDGQRGLSIQVEIQEGKCDSSFNCESSCQYR